MFVLINLILLYIHDLFFHSTSNFSGFYVMCRDVRELEERAFSRECRLDISYWQPCHAVGCQKLNLMAVPVWACISFLFLVFKTSYVVTWKFSTHDSSIVRYFLWTCLQHFGLEDLENRPLPLPNVCQIARPILPGSCFSPSRFTLVDLTLISLSKSRTKPWCLISRTFASFRLWDGLA